MVEYVCEGDFVFFVIVWMGEYFMCFIECFWLVMGDEYMSFGVNLWLFGVFDFVVEVGVRCQIFREVIEVVLWFWVMIIDNVVVDFVEGVGWVSLVLMQWLSEIDWEFVLFDWMMILFYMML